MIIRVIFILIQDNGSISNFVKKIGYVFSSKNERNSFKTCRFLLFLRGEFLIYYRGRSQISFLKYVKKEPFADKK